MSRRDLRTLTTTLQALHHTRIEAAPRAHRLDGQPHAPRHGRPANLAITHRVLITVLHLRLSLSHNTLAHLFGCSRSTIRRVITETREHLNDNGTTIEPDPHPTSLTELLTKIKKHDK
jgi:transcriptional antiterminator